MTWNLDLGNIFTPQIQSRGYLVGAHNLRWIYAIVSLELASTSGNWVSYESDISELIYTYIAIYSIRIHNYVG